MIKATTAIFLDSYHPKKGNKCAIKLRVTFQRTRKYYPTKYSLTPEEYEKLTSSKPGKYKDAQLELSAYEKKAREIIDSLPLFDWELFERKLFANRAAAEYVGEAFSVYIKELEASGRVGTASSYNCARVSIDKHKPNLRFTDVTPKFLDTYTDHMKEAGCSVTTVGIYLRSLRTIFNIAISSGNITSDLYPFGKRKYEIPTGRNIKKALTLSDISKIFNYKSDDAEKNKARDYWVFMYLCNGMNMKDLCLLREKNIDKDVLTFNRAKTARTRRVTEFIRIPLHDEARNIISRQGMRSLNREGYIFPVLRDGISPARERQLIQQKTKDINKQMKLIAQELGIESPTTTYSCRHSFATVLKRSGASTEFISEALGHSDLKTTKNYLDSFEDEKLREVTKALTAFS